MKEGFKDVNKTDETISFSIEGMDGVTISVEINKEKLQLRVIFEHHREIVQIERHVLFGSDEVIPMLLSFLAIAKMVNKKDELFACPNWNDSRRGNSIC